MIAIHKPTVIFLFLILSSFFYLTQEKKKVMNTEDQCLGLMKFGKSCYYFSPIAADWQVATDICQNALNATLVEMDAVKEFKDIAKYLKNHGHMFKYAWWVAVTDEGKKRGEWYFAHTKGTPKSIEWCPGQPNLDLRQSCLLMMWHSDSEKYCFDDYYCQSEYYLQVYKRIHFICEKQAV